MVKRVAIEVLENLYKDMAVIKNEKLWSCFLCGSPMTKPVLRKGLRIRLTDRTKHHLVPVSETDVTHPEIIYVHAGCHQRIHKFFSNKELLNKYADSEALKVEFLRRRKLHSQGKFKNYNYRDNLCEE